MTVRLRRNDVFVNCPFDHGYGPMFEAIVFGVYHLEFVARCACEEDDAGEGRLSKIERIIEQCRFGINDLSAVALDAGTGLPRFNTPSNWGYSVVASGLVRPIKARSGPDSRQRTVPISCVHFRHRGPGLRAHGGDPEHGIREVRDWLRTASKRKTLPGAPEIIDHYRQFRLDLPDLCVTLVLEPDRLTFLNLSTLITDWLKTRP